MDKKERRRERLRQMEEQRKAEALSRPRTRHESMGYRGAGRRLAQVVFRDSWEPLVLWEVRDLPGEWGGPDDGWRLALFRSASASPGSELLVGEEELAVGAAVLAAFLDRLYAVSVPVASAVPREDLVVTDGCRYELGLGGPGDSSSRFAWSGGLAPPGWEALDALTTEMVALFRDLGPAADAGGEARPGWAAGAHRGTP